MARSDPRQILLDAVVTYASHHGVSDLSLRELARAVGTSHRMLLYHFGSKEELLVAIVEANETAQRASVAEALATGDSAPLDVLRRVWDRLADPVMWPSERLFFELYGQALQGRPGTTALLDGIVSSWVEPAAGLLARPGEDQAEGQALARLNLAVVRGLLLDLLATGDRAGATGAMDLFLRLSATVADRGSAPSAH
jgi:AcrR family transcriptional regulator